jgi:hypothetical protein
VKDIIYLYHLRVQIDKVSNIIKELEADGWFYITSFALLEDNNIYQAHLPIKVRMLKNNSTLWVVVDPYGSASSILEP